jgi:hypothetical protein
VCKLNVDADGGIEYGYIDLYDNALLFSILDFGRRLYMLSC